MTRFCTVYIGCALACIDLLSTGIVVYHVLMFINNIVFVYIHMHLVYIGRE